MRIEEELISATDTLRAFRDHAKKTPPSAPIVDMSKVCCITLGGGQGTRLFPLTTRHCKPAILFGGRYRLIDVPLSNALNSNINKNYIVTQFLSASLHQHIFQTYRHDSFSSGFIELLGAEQKHAKTDWYKGTADAIRQNLEYLIETPAEYFLILSGDQLYHMDFQRMLLCAMQKDVDVLVATLAVNKKDASRMGIMKVSDEHHIVDFYEKPKSDDILDRLKTAPDVLEKMGLSPDSGRCYLGSMGIYLFKRSALLQLLRDDPREDFGKHLIPTKVATGSIAAFAHDGYWEDIGTIESFYEANIALTRKEPPFDLSPVMGNRSFLPGARISNTRIDKAIICEGSSIEADVVANSILGQRSIVKKGTQIFDSYVMGNDFYQVPMKDTKQLPEELVIDEGSTIVRAIIDKNVHIGKNVQLINKNNLTTYDSPNVYIRDGIIVVPRGAFIPSGFVL
jgi:glucose-1-phosphate adenylyltransferase